MFASLNRCALLFSFLPFLMLIAIPKSSKVEKVSGIFLEAKSLFANCRHACGMISCASSSPLFMFVISSSSLLIRFRCQNICFYLHSFGFFFLPSSRALVFVTNKGLNSDKSCNILLCDLPFIACVYFPPLESAWCCSVLSLFASLNVLEESELFFSFPLLCSIHSWMEHFQSTILEHKTFLTINF